MTKDVLKYLQPNAVIPIDMETTTALVNALKERLAQEKALQALHDENERLGLYKDAYGQGLEDATPPQRTEQGKELTKLVMESYDQGVKDGLQTILQLIRELRPAILPIEGKSTQEWFDILVETIKEKNK
jgi:uncharacterized protein (DUF2164 family)